jgi:lambda family phage portal protein
MFDFFKKKKSIKRFGVSSGAFSVNNKGPLTSFLSLLDKNDSFESLQKKGRIIGFNNEFGVHFLRTLLNKVNGPHGIKLQVRVKDKKGTYRADINELVEKTWLEWGKKGEADVTGKLSWKALRDLTITTVARDGEIFIHLVKGFENKFGFAIQLLESDNLDFNLNYDFNDKITIRNGIEYNEWGKPLAYWFYKDKNINKFHNTTGFNKDDYKRIESKNVLHIFFKKSVSQRRGETWFAPVIERMRVLYDYENAELVSSLIESSKLGFFSKKAGSNAQDFSGDYIDKDENPVINTEPGSMSILPTGWEILKFDPQHPVSNFDSFTNTILRGMATGLGMSYNHLANDLRNVNYSSLRSVALEDRDYWKTLQVWSIEEVENEIFSVWLEFAIISGKLKLSWEEAEEVKENIIWQCRGYRSVDPFKETKANVEALKNGLKTRTEILAEEGKDFLDTLEQLRYEKEKIEEYGIIID